MSLSDTFELSGHIVVKTGRGIGYHESVDEEVVFIGVAFSDASAAQPASDASAGLVESSDPSKNLRAENSPPGEHLPRHWQWWQDQGGALLHGGIMNGTLVHGRRKDKEAM